MPQFELCETNSHPARAMLHQEASNEFLRELFNSVNSLRRWITMVMAWEPIYETCSQADKVELLVRHITPVSELVLAAPQALKGRMIYAAASASNIANNFFFVDDHKLQYGEKTHINMKVAQKVGNIWCAWPAFAQALEKVNPDSWSIHTSDYRNAREHGHPRNIGLGLVAVVNTTGVGRDRKTGYGTLPAIPLRTVIECGIERHEAVISAYQALGTLLKEQHQALALGSAVGMLKPSFVAQT